MSQLAEHVSPQPGVAEEVRSFYDRYPYPRPIDNLENYRDVWQDRQRRRADFHLFWPARPYREDQSILVAGCGTSQAAKHALRWPDAQVSAIDISSTSVIRTGELKRKYKLKNLQVHQLPIERVRDLGMLFDQIVCTGVLHHLADPDTGLKALHGVLKPGGAAQLMVYAPYGRTGIYMLQDFCRRIHIPATDDGIQELICALSALPSGHPLENLLREAPDFRQRAALADALLHPQDRAYSVPQLFQFLDRSGLAFGRWLKQAPYSPCCGVIAKLAQASRMARLSAEEQSAAVELFRGTMIRHSVVAYRNDSQVGSPQVDFNRDAWLGYVPIRMPDTIAVEERLAPGVAAVLINRTHTYRDLVLPINSAEKRLFDGIDGNCAIGEILKKTLLFPPPDMVRTFFERLWRYDQVVFDISGAG